MPTAIDEKTKVTVKAGDNPPVETTLGGLKKLAERAAFRFQPLSLLSDDATLAPAEELEEIAANLMTECDELVFLQAFEFRVLWKKGGKLRWLGKTGTKGEEDRLIGGTDFVIRVAYDRCRAMAMTERQMEALIYHELCHYETDDDGKLRCIKEHDIEEFRAVVKRYGDWDKELQPLIEQLRLFDTEES